MKIAILSDTHGRLPAGVYPFFEGVDAIVHAGDIGREEVIFELEAVAPVYAVHGNVDDWTLQQRFPLWRAEYFEGVKFLITHIIAPITAPGLRHAFEKIGCDNDPDVVVYGHTHELKIQRVDTILTVNPGSVSEPRRGERPSLVIMEISPEGRISCRPCYLQQRGMK